MRKRERDEREGRKNSKLIRSRSSFVSFRFGLGRRIPQSLVNREEKKKEARTDLKREREFQRNRIFEIRRNNNIRFFRYCFVIYDLFLLLFFVFFWPFLNKNSFNFFLIFLVVFYSSFRFILFLFCLELKWLI